MGVEESGAHETPLALLLAMYDRLEGGSGDDLQEALALATRFLGMETGILSQVVGDRYTVEVCHAQPGMLEADQAFPLGQTCCSITLQVKEVVAIDHVKRSPHRTHPCFTTFALESYIGVPLFVRGGATAP